ncbi:MAG: helix-turn-helix domain-containing protein [Rhizomicrobium sp.]
MDEILINNTQAPKRATAGELPPTVAPYRIELTNASGHIRKLDELEAEIIRNAITRYGGHLSETARRLGLGRSTLYRKLKEYRMEGIGTASN